MDYNNEIIELLNKISSEMCSKIDGIHFEINSMKSAISTLNKKIEKNSKTMDVLCRSIDELYKSREIILKKLDSIKGIDSSIISDFNNKLKIIDETVSNVGEMISNSNNSAYNKFDSLNQDLRFLTHKIIQSEKDLFTIQEKLKNIHEKL